MKISMEDQELLKKMEQEVRDAKLSAKKAQRQAKQTQKNVVDSSRRERERTGIEKHCQKIRRMYGFSETDGGISALKLMSVVIMKRFGLLCLIALIVFVSLSSYYYFQGPQSATVIMSLNYEESSKGLAPNGTRYNIYALNTDEVLTKAIEYAGLNNSLRVIDLAKNLSVSEVYTRTPSDNDYYIATSYKLQLTKPKDLTGISVKNMLDLICRAYKDFFFKEYTNAPSVLAMDYSNTSDLEYNEIGSLFTLRTTQINRYLDMRIEESDTFTSPTTNETFKSLKKLASNLERYNIKNYTSFIWENGIVHNKSLYKRTLEYKNYELGMSYEEFINEYDIRIETIAEFNKAMTTSVLIPTLDSKNFFYMARTTSGIDTLAKEGDTNLANAVANNLSIKMNNDKLAKLPRVADLSNGAIANDMIMIITTELDRIDKLVMQVDEEYALQKTRNYLTFATRRIPLTQQIHFTRVLALSAAIFVLAYIALVEEGQYAIKKGGF